MPDEAAEIRYPKDVLDLRQMNRELRHRLRNLCAGVKMTIDRITMVTASTHPQLSDRCRIINSEMDGLQRFTERLDLLFDLLPPPQPLSLFEIAFGIREVFIKQFPLCSFDLDGEELAMEFQKGSWLLTSMTELIANAGEAAGAEGKARLSWRFEKDGSMVFSILNTGAAFPKDLKLSPPVPFTTPKSRHDGIGLAITYRICKEASFTLDFEQNRSEGAAVSIRIPPGDFLNGQT